MHISACILVEIVSVCCVQRVSSGPDDFSLAERQAAALAADFSLRGSMLYTLLQSSMLQAGHRAPALRQLLLRLNFNGFVEKAAMKAAAKT